MEYVVCVQSDEGFEGYLKESGSWGFYSEKTHHTNPIKRWKNRGCAEGAAKIASSMSKNYLFEADIAPD